MTQEELDHLGYLCIGYFKTVCNPCNTAAQMVMYHAHDQVKKHPAYKREVKKKYKAALDAMNTYRNTLKTIPTMFSLSDLKPKDRKRFSPTATSTDYYDWWESIGAQAYEKAKTFIYSMQHKYYKSLLAHGAEYADILAWVLTETAILAMADDIYQRAVRQSVGAFHLYRSEVIRLCHYFSLDGVAKAWKAAMYATADIGNYRLTEEEDMNITNGLEQLAQIWVAPDTVYGAASEATADFPELFASKAQQRKTMSTYAELKAETEETIRQNKMEDFKRNSFQVKMEI